MLFANRKEAGRELAEKLLRYAKSDDTIVVGLPRGGVVVAYEVAKALSLPLEITCPRKIGAPGNAEFAIGAVAETGEVTLDERVASLDEVHSIIEAEHEEAQRRARLYRGGRPSLTLHGKRVLLVDDGIATGSTMHAALRSLHSLGAREVVIAVPVAPEGSEERFRGEADRFICLHQPTQFYAVGQFYKEFPSTTDEEVIELLHLLQ